MSVRRLSRPLRHGVAAALLWLLFATLRLLPERLALAVGAGLGRAVGVLARSDRRLMAAQLALLSDPPSPGDCFADLGRRLVELADARRALRRFVVTPESRVVARQTLAEGRGVLVATLHLGNWELMGAALAALGFPVAAVSARRLKGPLGAWLARTRKSLEIEVLEPNKGGARGALQRLRAGEAVALFVDQNTGERSRPVSFLGRAAPTPVTLERLAALTGAPVLFAWTARTLAGQHEVHLEPVPASEAPLDFAARRLTALLRTYPAQWVWLHDRFAARTRKAARVTA